MAPSYCGASGVWDDHLSFPGLCVPESVCAALQCVLALVSSREILVARSFDRRRHATAADSADLPGHGVHIFNVVCALLLAASYVLSLADYLDVDEGAPVAIVLSCVTGVIAWTLHASAHILNRSRLHGPLHPAVSAACMLSLAAIYALRAATVIIAAVNGDSWAGIADVVYLCQSVICVVAVVLAVQDSRHVRAIDDYFRSDDHAYVHEPVGLRRHLRPILRGGHSETDHLLGGRSDRTLPEDLSPEDEATWLSRVFLVWIGPLMALGKSRPLEQHDLPPLPVDLSVAAAAAEFRDCLSSQRMAGRDGDSEAHGAGRNARGGSHEAETVESSPARSLLHAFNRMFGWSYYPLGLLKFVADCAGFGGPLLLSRLVDFVEDGTQPLRTGILYGCALVACSFLGSLFSTQYDYRVNRIGLRVRAAMVTAIYTHTLGVPSPVGSTAGGVANLMSTDADRIVNFCNSFHQFWSLPFQILVSLYLLYLQVGIACLAGVAVAVVLIPINRVIAVKIAALSQRMMRQKDERVKVTNEVLYGIRVIKLYAWEVNFADRIGLLRRAELASLKGKKYLDALCVYFWATTPVLISILTFTTYSLTDHTLTAARVFTSLSLFNLLISPLNAFPWVINGLLDAWVSVKRVGAFFRCPVIDRAAFYCTAPDADDEHLWHVHGGSFATASGGARLRGSTLSASTAGHEDTEDSLAPRPTVSVAVHSGTFAWPRRAVVGIDDVGGAAPEDVPTTSEDDRGSRMALCDITLDVHVGEFVGIAGKVGSGKSALLASILAETSRTHGSVYVAGLSPGTGPRGIGYAPQQGWVRNATLRDNIVFGRAFDRRRYDAVLDACALREDLKALPAGDLTEIGENGTNLSGGQRQRVALARAAYSADAEVFVLDDPLSAVDAPVGQHIVTHCIRGLLAGRTRILCTHHTRHLVACDRVLVLENGRVVLDGRPSTHPELLNYLMASSPRLDTGAASGTAAPESPRPSVDAGPPLTPESARRRFDAIGESAGASGHRLSLTSFASESPLLSRQLSDDNALEEKPAAAVGRAPAPSGADEAESLLSGALVEEEERATGVVEVHVYRRYWRAVGRVLAPAVLVSLAAMQASRNGADFWLSVWVGAGGGNEAVGRVGYHLGVYGAIAGANSLFTLVRSFLFAFGGIVAAERLHDGILSSVLVAPVSFFDMTPIGRILNRFSSDMYAVDDSLPFMLNIFLAQSFGIVGTLAITCYGLRYFAFALVPLGALYYVIQSYYRQTSREIKRLDTISRSPVYAHFSETIAGASTIRAFCAEDGFEEENRRNVDANLRATFAGFAVAQWLNVRLQMIGVALLAVVVALSVAEHHFHGIDPSLVGLSVAYALSVTGLLSGAVTALTETEKEMVSVERIGQYTDGVPAETQAAACTPPPNWPLHGAVVFKDVRLRYRVGLSPALECVSFEVRAGERVGLAGRTGSGKSSVFLALFRIVEAESGTISIDGVNIRTVSLPTLRSRISIIPQDPVLFGGNVRDNLDPFGQHSDDEVWAALDRCHMRDVVASLNDTVEEKGSNFSVGQKQLLCLGRALLRRSKILCIDEATASVDKATDELIRAAIRTEFADATVITIAHRIESILDSDRVIVLDRGRVAEFDAPAVLLSRPDSLFAALVSGAAAPSRV